MADAVTVTGFEEALVFAFRGDNAVRYFLRLLGSIPKAVLQCSYRNLIWK